MGLIQQAGADVLLCWGRRWSGRDDCLLSWLLPPAPEAACPLPSRALSAPSPRDLLDFQREDMQSGVLLAGPWASHSLFPPLVHSGVKVHNLHPRPDVVSLAPLGWLEAGLALPGGGHVCMVALPKRGRGRLCRWTFLSCALSVLWSMDSLGRQHYWPGGPLTGHGVSPHRHA